MNPNQSMGSYYGDHGGALPRGKRNIHDSGTRVPLIIRFPTKWAHLAPAQPGQWVEELVSFVDFPATVFSLCGVPIPANYEGRPLGRVNSSNLPENAFGCGRLGFLRIRFCLADGRGEDQLKDLRCCTSCSKTSFLP